MSDHRMIVAVLLLLCICLSTNPAIGNTDPGGTGMETEEMFVHPFLVHMGIPDQPNAGSLRLTAYQTRFSGMTNSDLAVHIESGLVPRIGLHIRSDGIERQAFSEIMLQYAVIANKELSQGMCVFGQLNIPTGPVEHNDYRGLFGISGRLNLPAFMILDVSVHFDPEEKMIEYEAAFVFRASSKYYPILEVRGDSNEEREIYVLPAIKYRLAEHSAFGVGFQVPVSEQKAYDSQALFTYDIGF